MTRPSAKKRYHARMRRVAREQNVRTRSRAYETQNYDGRDEDAES